MKKGLFFILIFLLVGCSTSSSIKYEPNIYDILDIVVDNAYVEEMTIYGRYFNLKGTINQSLENLSLVFKNEIEEIEYPLILETKENLLEFKTNKLINEGIDLENIKLNEYILFLKNDDHYYNLVKKTDIANLEYYTITRNGLNYQIKIDFASKNNRNYLHFQSKQTSLPNNIYDIVIDPGHGGIDIGASYENYTESQLNLSYALLLKEKLEALGLKIKLTRDKDIAIKNYGESGRVSIPYQTKAKLLLSMHLNSATGVKNGGVEIYVPNHSNTRFAKSIADNIVDKTSTIYSPNGSSRIDKGIYLRTLTKKDLENIEKEAKEDGYIPYEKATLDSTYYYIIRETGGIITGAYIDTRNPKKEGNPYYNSNHGCESYLLELGYINSKNNLNVLLNEKDKYIEAILEAIKKELKME